MKSSEIFDKMNKKKSADVVFFFRKRTICRTQRKSLAVARLRGLVSYGTQRQNRTADTRTRRNYFNIYLVWQARHRALPLFGIIRNGEYAGSDI